jgi:hypothetical protein
MAIIEKKDPGAGDPAGEPAQPRHNLPLKTAPVVGRRPEMQRVVQVFEKIRRDGRPRRVEVVGPLGVGASTVAIELARRAGHRFPGGAWYLNLGMGADLAWATVGAQRGSGPVRDLAAAARKARERLGEDPKSLLVIDGATSAEETTAALPPAGEQSADVFVVGEKPIGTVDADQRCEVEPVPSHGARRIAAAMMRASQPDAKPPAVRTNDGLALTATISARAALAFQGREGPMWIENIGAAMNRMIRLVGRNPIALELLILSSVAHPVCMPIDSLMAGLVAVRQGRGETPKQEEAAQGVMWLAHAGILEPLDERHFSMHPLVQDVVRGIMRTPADLALARAALTAGLVAEAEGSIGEDGVDVQRAALHQLRHMARTADGDAKAQAVAAVAKVEAALGIAGTGSS